MLMNPNAIIWTKLITRLAAPFGVWFNFQATGFPKKDTFFPKSLKVNIFKLFCYIIITQELLWNRNKRAYLLRNPVLLTTFTTIDNNYNNWQHLQQLTTFTTIDNIYNIWQHLQQSTIITTIDNNYNKWQHLQQLTIFTKIDNNGQQLTTLTTMNNKYNRQHLQQWTTVTIDNIYNNWQNLQQLTIVQWIIGYSL